VRHSYYLKFAYMPPWTFCSSVSAPFERSIFGKFLKNETKQLQIPCKPSPIHIPNRPQMEEHSTISIAHHSRRISTKLQIRRYCSPVTVLVISDQTAEELSVELRLVPTRTPYRAPDVMLVLHWAFRVPLGGVAVSHENTKLLSSRLRIRQ
jgi:hypothetical protein